MSQEQIMTFPLFTAFTAAFLGFVQVFLMILVGNARRQLGIPLGDDGNEALLYKIRRHGNFIENAPIFLILLGFLEMAGGQETMVKIFAGTFALTRISHAYSMSGPGKPFAARAAGAFGTLIGILGTAGMLLWQLMHM